MKKFYQLIVASLLLTVTATAAAQESPILTLPEGGTTKLYQRAGGAYYAILGNQFGNIEYSYLPSEIVEYDNGDVYVKDFFSQYDYSYYGDHPYIKGHKDGSTITFEMPQLMSVRTYTGSTQKFHVSMVEYSALKRTFLPVSGDKNKYVINVNADGTLEAPLVNEGYFFPGKIDDNNEWVYEGEVFCKWTPMTDTEVSVPEGLQCTSMSLLDVNGFGRYLNVGFDNNDVYVKGVFDMAPEAWIKGTRDGNKISFGSGQYMGFSPSGKFFSYFTGAQFETEYDSETKEDVRVLKFRDAITFDYDEAAGKLTAPEGWLMVYNKNPDHIDYMEYIEAPVIENIPENISKQVSDPWNLDRHLPTSATDLEYISFCISALNTDGKLLDPNKLYYRIFYNGQPYTFLPGQYTYPGLDGPTQFIPFNFENGGSFSLMDALRLIYVYENKIKIETVGVQLYYIEGEPNEENIVTRSKLVTYPETAANTTPKDPWKVSHYVPEKPWDPSESVSFNVEAVNTDGEALDESKLYYRLFFNGEPYTFPAQSGINEEMTFVPVNFTDQYNIAFTITGTKRTANIYGQVPSDAVVGVQLYYIEGEPKEENIVSRSEMVTYPEAAPNTTPKDPWGVSHYVPEKPWDPSESVSFNVEAVNTDGESLDESKLYYRLFFNGEPYTFPAMANVNEEMSFVPVNFTDQYNIAFTVTGTKRTANIYTEGLTAAVVGVQLYYIEGEATEANIVAQSALIAEGTSSIEGAVVLKTIESTVYYNLAGCRVAEPADGVYIKVVKYSDGTVETTKVKK